MKKCIIFARCSTERQEVQSQIDETIEYARKLEFDEFKIISRVGASAYKVSQLYLEMVEELKHSIETDKSIEAVVCWHLNRLARNDTVATEIKEFLINHKIQLYIKEPTLKLLNDDGTVNSGAELAFSIFATMSKQQAAELKEKSKLGKRKNMALHKYLGGPCVKYGYKVNPDNNLIEPDEEKAAIVREIFDIYLELKSYHKTATEINERHGLNLNYCLVEGILQSPKYHDNTIYPPIISEKTYNEALAIRQNNNLGKDLQHKNRRFLNRILKCPNCGKGYTANVRDYRHTCDCDIPNVAITKFDGLLWLVASHLEGQRLLNETSKEEFLQKKAVLEAKIASVGNYTAKGEKRAERAKKMALMSLISIEEYQSELKKIEKDTREVENKIEEWTSQIKDLENLMAEDRASVAKILKVSDQITDSDEKAMRDIVRRWITGVTIDDNFNVKIETHTRTYQCIYRPYMRLQPFFTNSGRQIIVRHVLRTKGGGCALKDVKKTYLKDIPATALWLEGSEIV